MPGAGANKWSRVGPILRVSERQADRLHSRTAAVFHRQRRFRGAHQSFPQGARRVPRDLAAALRLSRHYRLGQRDGGPREGGERATIIFCSFSRNPLVLRLFGRTRIGQPGSALWGELSGLFEMYPGARQIVLLDIDSAQTACGFGVPEMNLKKPRSTLTKYWDNKGEAATAEYRERKNKVSIDGLPTGWGEG
jgi:hypothetical protein